ncbi:MAG: flagellar hook-associated protein FlgK [Peptococcaceae bacterium]|nr:flagellar hook-associated protein FlgK [Peptococcaceae bacterium]
MRSTFAGLELGKNALAAQQYAIDTAGHNISNAGTKGYTRQVSNLVTSIPNVISAMGHNVSIGSGVTIESISRIRDAFVDRQFRWETSKEQYWSEKLYFQSNIQAFFNEPADDSLHKDLSNFWIAWSELSKDPENSGARALVLERGRTLVDSFHRLAQQLTDLENDLKSKVQVQVDQINSYASQIKDLNMQIQRAEVAGDTPNDLYDARDKLVDELSKIVSVRVTETQDSNFKDRYVGVFKIEIASEVATAGQELVLVDHDQVWELQGEEAEDPPPNFSFSLVGSDTKTFNLESSQMGSLAAEVELLDKYLPGIMGELDKLVQDIVENVNDFYTKNGSYPDAFFDGLSAADIALNSSITEDNLRTGDGNIGDGSIASKIAALSGSIGDSYGTLIARLGANVQQSERMAQGEAVLLNQLLNQKESVSGVSLDEEMTNIIKFQKSYAAAARLVTVLDDMLEKIISGMGITR